METTTVAVVKIAVVDGVNLINTTPHSIRFQAVDGSLVEVPPCGYQLDARAVETEAGQGFGGVRVVRTQFVPTEAATKWINDFRAENPDVVIVGSIIAAQAFPGQVYAMVPVPGFERVAPAEKRMDPHKWTTF